jgi:hypothetical protein
MKIKGSDASNKFDEEINDDEEKTEETGFFCCKSKKIVEDKSLENKDNVNQSVQPEHLKFNDDDDEAGRAQGRADRRIDHNDTIDQRKNEHTVDQTLAKDGVFAVFGVDVQWRAVVGERGKQHVVHLRRRTSDSVLDLQSGYKVFVTKAGHGLLLVVWGQTRRSGAGGQRLVHFQHLARRLHVGVVDVLAFIQHG